MNRLQSILNIGCKFATSRGLMNVYEAETAKQLLTPVEATELMVIMLGVTHFCHNSDSSALTQRAEGKALFTKSPFLSFSSRVH